MEVHLCFVVSGSLSSAPTIATVLAVGSVTADHGTKLLDASMTGIPTAGQSLLGVAGGGVP